MKTRSFDGSDGVRNTVRRPILRKHWRQGRTHYVLQFRIPMNDEIRAELTLRGAVITGTVPDDAVMIAAGDDFSAEGLDLVFMEEMDPADKVSPIVGTHNNDSAFVVEFHSDVEPEAARELLRSEGLTVLEHPDLAPEDVLFAGSVDDVARLKDWDEVAYVYPAPYEMVGGERFHNCVGALSSGMKVPQYVQMGHGWSTDASGRVNLGYAFSQLTGRVPEATVKQEVIRAMAEWSKVARVQFSPASSITAPRTIAVKFAMGDHGDGFPFDGANGTLAHTFYPANPEPSAGDVHFDDAEGWHAGTNIDIYTVALHELGHALGLGHSDQPGAIMYPYYRFPSQIGIDDIAGIQAIYGAPAVTTPAAPAAPATPAFSVAVQTPVAGTIPVNTTAVNFAGTILNATGAVTVTWQTSQGASGRATVNGTGWSAAAIPTPSGTTTVTLTATDSSHRTATTSVVLNRPASAVADQTAPSLALAAPSGTNSQTTLASIAASGTASDNVGVVRVTWQNGSLGGGTATGTSSWNVPQIPLLIGNNTIVFRAYDAAGNSSWRSITVSRR